MNTYVSEPTSLGFFFLNDAVQLLKFFMQSYETTIRPMYGAKGSMDIEGVLFTTSNRTKPQQHSEEKIKLLLWPIKHPAMKTCKGISCACACCAT
jgi:hypothetical protein